MRYNVPDHLLQIAKKVLLGLLVYLTTVDVAFSQALQSQAKIISGKVTSANGDGLPDVSVLFKGTSIGTTTAKDGGFRLTVPDEKGTLIVSYVGFSTEEIALNGKPSINITLTEANKALQEVVVMGYTSKNQAQLSSSVAVITAQELKGVTAPNLGSLLQGKASGVMVSGGGGQPGTAPTVRIRGTGSISAGSDPLYVVDGVIGGTANPSDIESVTV